MRSPQQGKLRGQTCLWGHFRWRSRHVLGGSVSLKQKNDVVAMISVTQNSGFGSQLRASHSVVQWFKESNSHEVRGNGEVD